MKTLIFEGIATSGKSTLIKELDPVLRTKLKVRVATENETHVPIMDDREGLHVEFFRGLLASLISERPDLLILDRLYMTQAFRARSDLSGYKEFEEFLLQFNPITIFLTVNEDTISERIQKATEHREPEWADYIKSRGQEEQIAQYYINQQRSQLKLLKQSIVPYKIFDTTNHDYETVVKELINTIKS